MSDVVISVENLGKQYRLGNVGTGTLSSDLKRWWHLARGKEDPFLKVGEENNREKRGNSDYVWALKDINFEVKKGEVLGIIGKNGAGKSTLLKILSRTTTPTTGNFKVKGRIASLLEVGTGFHPELTGRENIFLNGAILGMTKIEIKNKFDEIVDFSGVERYIDTPVKRYSSGMYVRLAFAVAAHLESEILILDEVLAVGDAEFQKKCLGKMKDVSGTHGRTVLFVSHNLTAVKTLCTSALYLKNGTIHFAGKTQDAVDRYFESAPKTETMGIIPDAFERYNTGEIKIREIALLDKNKNTANEVFFRSPIDLRIRMEAFKKVEDALIDVKVVTKDGIVITHSMNDGKTYSLDKGNHEFEIKLENILQPGLYSLSIGVHYATGSTIDYLESIYDFSILKIAKGDASDSKWVHGFVQLNSTWAKTN
ncbi:MAG: ABC transporter ATP-binding protein [Bacteroidia bacterium]